LKSSSFKCLCSPLSKCCSGNNIVIFYTFIFFDFFI
jgi:hypothetical protein